jgi:hypothetical protein
MQIHYLAISWAEAAGLCVKYLLLWTLWVPTEVFLLLPPASSPLLQTDGAGQEAASVTAHKWPGFFLWV